MTAELLMKNAHVIKPHNEESAWFVTRALVSSGVAMSIAGSSRPAQRERAQVRACPRSASRPAKHSTEKPAVSGRSSRCTSMAGTGKRSGKHYGTFGAPVTPKEIGIEDSVAVEALLMAKTIRPERFTILDMGLTEESAWELVRMLYRE